MGLIRNIAKTILTKKAYLFLQSKIQDKEEQHLVDSRKKFYSQFLKTGDTFFDVGANLGNRIRPIIDMDLKIIAVEPQEAAAFVIEKRFGDKVTVVNKGLGEEAGKLTLHISDTHTLSSFSEDFIESTQKSGRFSKYKWQEKQEAEITTLDNLINEYGKPAFIKIDVEGFEHKVLLGLNREVDCISLEYTVPERLDTLKDCIERIDEINTGETLFNYSVGESMTWALERWLNRAEMLHHVESDEFVETDFGDIYARKATGNE